MEVQELILRNFRNYEEVHIPLTEGVNLIQGENGAGKTTLLEALYLLSTGRSFVTSHLTDLIRKGSPHFYVEVRFVRDGVEQQLSIGFDGKNRRIHYNNSHFSHFSHVLGILPSVLYSPKDSALITGSPQERRRFLNIQLAQTDPLYVHHLMRYHKAMKHRNALLKVKSESAIETWEQMMAESARYLMTKRKALIEALLPRLKGHLEALAPDLFDLRYEPSISLKKMEQIEALYKKQRPKELIIGMTLTGPHRDDLYITYNRQDAKTFASEGQKRTCIAALKMAEWDELAAQTNAKPLLSIDDFGVHLDPGRTALLEEKLKDFGQVLLTSPSSSEQATLQITDGKITSPSQRSCSR
ncbi:DNA replication/repair protein RecF [Candidatus Neptunochlamydia vexilliferae]|uniref:DNA replication/repair protein RecF n=1 Tax=Candidatus Neptunichlamydia vexilliferae TaxID=1651774 RepID=UPI0018911F3E|nr:DNA replication/repair protein RecF [Candidatus Neptunochlamydia vexilliferae]